MEELSKISLCEGCQAQQICHVSDGRGYDRQEVICQDIVSDRTIALLFCLTTPLWGWFNGYVSLKCDISLFIKHIRSKIERLACRKYLPKELGRDNIRLSIRLLRILTTHNFDMENLGLL